MDIGYKSDKGKLRISNEDALHVAEDSNFFVVADGVGGSNAGEVASRTAVLDFARCFADKNLESFGSESAIEEHMRQCIEKVNRRILALSHEKRENSGMATTLVAFLIHGNRMYLINIGDSRGYICRDGRMLQITEDHTYVNGLIQAGIISEEQAMNHKDRHMITRAVGAEETIDADLFKVSIKQGDIIMICTDGLYGEVSDQSMIGILSQDKSMQEITDELVDSANIQGGHDNITVVCVKITEEDDI